jgi:uncharacterized protein
MIRAWSKDHPLGTEFVEVSIGAGKLSATGAAIGTEPVPYRLEYELTTADRYVTARLVVRSRGQDWQRFLDLKRSAAGVWSCSVDTEGGPDIPPPGGDLAAVAGALDCDLALSPLTNSMPVLRHGLHEHAGEADLLMAWVSVPDLGIHPSRQRYTFRRFERGLRIVYFQSLDTQFAADVTFDDAGVVVDYPGIARSVA